MPFSKHLQSSLFTKPFFDQFHTKNKIPTACVNHDSLGIQSSSRSIFRFPIMMTFTCLFIDRSHIRVHSLQTGFVFFLYVFTFQFECIGNQSSIWHPHF